MNNKQFKDECDGCGKMAVCKGYNGQVLCTDCITKQEGQNNGDKN